MILNPSSSSPLARPLGLLILVSALAFRIMEAPVLYRYNTDGAKLSPLAAAERVTRESCHLAWVTLLAGDGHPATAMGRTRLALAYEDQGRYTEAEPLLKQAVSRWVPTPDDELVHASYCVNLAELWAHQGRYAEAEQLYRRYLTVYEGWFGGRCPLVINQIATLCLYQGKYDESERLSQEVLLNWETNADSPYFYDSSVAMFNLGRIRLHQRRYRDSEALSRAALGVRRIDIATAVGETADQWTGSCVGGLNSATLWEYGPSLRQMKDQLSHSIYLQERGVAGGSEANIVPAGDVEK